MNELIPKLFTLLQADAPKWVDILEEACKIESAQYIDRSTNLTPLHLAVMSRDRTNNAVRVGVIRSLLQSDLESTEIQCYKHGFTPLMYACRVFNLEHLELDAHIAKLILEFNVDCFYKRDEIGHSALDVHIMSMSRLMQSTGGGSIDLKKDASRSLVLKELANVDLRLDLARSLDLLLTCNSLETMRHLAEIEANTDGDNGRKRGHQRKSKNSTQSLSSSTAFQNYWVWEFILVILKAEHHHTYRGIKPVPPFNALHTAAQVVDFPLPFMILCMHAYPNQVKTPSVDHGDLPVHTVAGWEVSDSRVARKSMTLTQLIHRHPLGSRCKNAVGKTPLSLALETGTAWDNGVRRLTASQQVKNPL